MTPLIGFGAAAIVAGLIAIALHAPWGRWSARHTYGRHLPGGDPAPDRHTPEAYARTILISGVAYVAFGVVVVIVGVLVR